MTAEKAQHTMWDGRFETKMAGSMERLSFSLRVDVELIEEDIDGSVAHTAGLLEAGVLTAEERAKIVEGLEGIRADFRAGKDLFDPDSDEDVHMAVERVLTERLGPLGKKLHTGRSRNDQVSTDFKLYMRRKAERLLGQVRALQKALFGLAEGNQGRLMPGYTHLQQAQPVQFSHYMLSFFFALERDAGRLRDFLARHRQMPLGSGAIAGSAFPYHRDLVARELGFPEISDNSIDAVSHRDAALEFLSDLAILGTTLSRYAEDFVLWSTSEFGFLRLSDAFSSGSSMMPQKKNPDSMELIRGKSGRLAGDFVAMATLVKGAPMAYSRDLQEDKEPVFDAARTASVMLDAMREALETAVWDVSRMREAMLPDLLATDLADLLVKQGVPFRDAHHIVGSLVGKAARRRIPFTSLPPEEWEGVPEPKEIKRQLTFENSVARRDLPGGTGPNAVKAQLETARRLLAEA
ncbi:MAG: argininosuccinate lyase [Fibrobacterales bacterium]|nr:argininosuccinate lyase [Fibrobacterales bacterium]